MAVTARRQFLFSAAVLLTPGCVKAQDTGPARGLLHDVATSLSDGNASIAMDCFSKSFVNYDKLNDYFTALTGSYEIANEIDVSDEDDLPAESKATVRWSLTLSSRNGYQNERLADGQSHQHTAELNVRAIKEKKKWKIVEFAPIDLFDPSRA